MANTALTERSSAHDWFFLGRWVVSVTPQAGCTFLERFKKDSGQQPWHTVQRQLSQRDAGSSRARAQGTGSAQPSSVSGTWRGSVQVGCIVSSSTQPFERTSEVSQRIVKKTSSINVTPTRKLAETKMRETQTPSRPYTLHDRNCALWVRFKKKKLKSQLNIYMQNQPWQQIQRCLLKPEAVASVSGTLRLWASINLSK